MTTPSYAAKLRGGAGGGGSRFFSDSRPPVQDPPLHHVPALSENAVFIDLRVIKPSVDQVERNDFLLKDLQVSVDEIADIWPEPESQLLRLVFFTAEQHQRYLTRLTAGVPWAACNGALVYGWAPGDAVTAVRLTGVPANLPEAAIRAHFAQFDRVTRVFRSKDKVFTRACNGIVHISIAVAPGFALPAFVSLVDDDGTTDKRMLVHTDAFRRRCSRCGTTGHVAQFCRAGHRAAGAQEALWSVLRIPADLLPPAEPAATASAVLRTAADSSRAAPVPSTPSSSTMPGGGSLNGSVAAAREVVAPTGGAAPATGAASPAAADARAASAAAADGPSQPAAADASSQPAAADAPAADGSLSPLLLQVSALSDGSLPLGQGSQRPEDPAASTAASQPLSPLLSPISTISNSSYQSTQSRDPRLNRSASAHSRNADTEAEDDFALPANTNARPGRKRVLSGGKSGPTKATRKQSKGRSVSLPSQHISQDASP